MRRLLLSAALLAAANAPLAAQTVVDFEDLSGLGALPSTYAGIDWLGGWNHYDWSQPPFNPSSGTQRVYRHATLNQFGFAGGPAEFQGAYFAGMSSVYFELYLGDDLVHTSATLALSGLPTFLSSGYDGAVSRVDVRVIGGSAQWVMDDVTYGAAATITPEPASVALVGIGLAGLGGVAARRRRRAQRD